MATSGASNTQRDITGKLPSPLEADRSPTRAPHVQRVSNVDRVLRGVDCDARMALDWSPADVRVEQGQHEEVSETSFCATAVASLAPLIAGTQRPDRRSFPAPSFLQLTIYSKCIKSVVFGDNEHQWEVLWYPNSGVQGGEFASLYLSCVVSYCISAVN